MTELFMRLIFSFVVGNSDMHLKNFSLIETHEVSLKSKYLELCDNSLLSQPLKERFSELLEKRCKILEEKSPYLGDG